MAKEICLAKSKGILAQPDLKAYQLELSRVAVEVDKATREELHREVRNMLRLLVIGGPQEQPRAPVADSEFLPADPASTCTIDDTTTSRLALPPQLGESSTIPSRDVGIVPYVTVPDGLPVRLAVTESLNSSDSRSGDAIHLKVDEDVEIGGRVAIPRGSMATGHVVQNEQKKSFGRTGKLDVRIDEIAIGSSSVKVRGESKRKGKGSTTKMIVMGASLVAIPLIPVVKGKDAVIPEGTIVTAYIDGEQKVAISTQATVNQGLQLPMATLPASISPDSNSAVSNAPNIQSGQSVLNVKSDPAGADITIDGEFVGNTPSTIRVSAGRHAVVVSKKGFSPWQRTLSVVPEGNVTLDASLEKLQ